MSARFVAAMLTGGVWAAVAYQLGVAPSIIGWVAGGIGIAFCIGIEPPRRRKHARRHARPTRILETPSDS